MLTDEDLKKIQLMFSPVIKELVSLRQDVDTLKENISILPTRDEYLSEADKIYGELQAIRESMEIQTGYKDQREDHEVRIEKLELVVN